MTTATPILTETTHSVDGDYETRWMVNPPPEGTLHRVTADDWNDDFTVRHIYAWKPAQ